MPSFPEAGNDSAGHPPIEHNIVVSELDEAWRSVRDLLGSAATDFSGALAEGTHRIGGIAGDNATVLEDAAGTGASMVRRTEPDIPDVTSGVSRGTVTAATSSVYKPGRDLVDVADYTALRSIGGSAVRGADPTMVRIQALQGFDGLPTRVSAEEIQSAIDAGQPELFRGFEKDSYVEDFLNKPPRPGGGTTGIGTYATPLKDVGLSYTNPARLLSRAVESRALRMTLRPGSRTIDLIKLKSDQLDAMSQIERDLKPLRNIMNRTDEQQARYDALQNKQLTILDTGRYAALRGYDAIDGSRVWRNREWLIVNHTALLVQR